MTFDEWMERIDRSCQMDYGLSVRELPDMCFRDAYDSGFTPEDFMAENRPDGESLGRLVVS